jgi:hypothetical protein
MPKMTGEARSRRTRVWVFWRDMVLVMGDERLIEPASCPAVLTGNRPMRRNAGKPAPNAAGDMYGCALSTRFTKFTVLKARNVKFLLESRDMKTRARSLLAYSNLLSETRTCCARPSSWPPPPSSPTPPRRTSSTPGSSGPFATTPDGLHLELVFSDAAVAQGELRPEPGEHVRAWACATNSRTGLLALRYWYAGADGSAAMEPHRLRLPRRDQLGFDRLSLTLSFLPGGS